MIMAKTKEDLKSKTVGDPADDPQAGTQMATRPTGTNLATVDDFGDDAGKGMEGLDASEYRIPFLRILDPKSPQCAPTKAGGLGAAPGMFFNIATGEMFDGDKGFEAIFCHRSHKFVEWKKRNQDGSGGGFVAEWEVDNPRVQKLLKEQGRFKKLQTTAMIADKDGRLIETATEIVETFVLHILQFDPYGGITRVILGFSGMQCRKYTALINRYDAIKYKVGVDEAGRAVMKKPPLWAHRWRITSQYEKRGEQSWYGFVIELAARDKDGKEDRNPIASLVKMSDPVYKMGAEFYTLISTGRVKAEYGTADQGGGTDDADAIPM